MSNDSWVAVGIIIWGVSLAIFSWSRGRSLGEWTGYRRGYEAGASDTFRILAQSTMRWRADANPIIKPH